MFITLSKDKSTLHCFIYEFADKYDYNSITLVQQCDYKVHRKNSNKILENVNVF